MFLIDMIIDALERFKYWLSEKERLRSDIRNLLLAIEEEEANTKFWFDRTRHMDCPHCKERMVVAKPVNLSKLEWDNKIRVMEDSEGV